MLFKNITEINPKVIKILIDKSSEEHTKIKNLYERYRQTTNGVPILTRKYMIGTEEQKDKINNKIANDFVGEIVDMKVGFFCGVPITYALDKSKYQQEKNIVTKAIDKVKSMFTDQEPKKETVLSASYDKDLQIINDFNKLNQIADLDLETAKRATICGSCGRLLYIDPIDKQIKIKLIEPWEVIYIGDTIENPTWTIRYYETVSYEADGKEKKTIKVEVYYDNRIEYYVQNDNKEFVADSLMPTITHFWKAVPLWGFANNDEFLGDCNKVLSLIDAYDKLTSDMSSESESWRLAYMIFKGCSISADDIKTAQRTGAFSLPDKDAEANFLTKEINNTFQENFLKLLENNIYRFSATPNMNDISFGGNLTGVAMKYKFRPFEDKCKRSELKFKKSFQSQYTKLCNVWNVQGKAIDPMNMDYVFTRNYPQNLPEEITMVRDGKGIFSQKTLFGLVSFISDPEKEIKALEQEQQQNLDEFIKRNEALAQTGQSGNQDNPDDTANKGEPKPPEDKTLNAVSNKAKE
jgi:SPP1 family phage portal protein